MSSVTASRVFRHFFERPAGLTERQQQLIRSSFARILPVQEAAAAAFFDRLFTLDPRLCLMFKRDINDPHRKLMTVMSIVVDQCHDLRQFVPSLRELGRRYDRCGATDRDYDTVAAALIWTLEKELAADFTPETREAWMTCYGVLANEMRCAAHEQKIPLLPPC